MRRAIGLLLGLALAGVPLVAADDVELTASVDAEKVGVEDMVQLTIAISGRGLSREAEPALPPLKNLKRVGGPSVSTQVSFVNGDVSQSKSYTYVLAPIAPGPAEVGKVRIRLADGTEKTAGPIAIEVVAGSVKPRAQHDPFARDPFGEDPFDAFFGRRRARPRAEPKIFVSARLSRDRVRVGEPVLLTYDVCTQTAITDLQFAESPQYPGFWVEDVPQGKGPPQGKETTVAGESCVSFSVVQKLLFPTRAGRLEIPAVTLRLGLPRQSVFDRGPGAAERTTEPAAVTVLSLPEDADVWGGAVGQFTLSASLDKAEVALGEAATLRLELSGRGNLKWIEANPEVAVTGAKVYPPRVDNDIAISAGGMSGSKTWEYVVVPETSGELVVPSLSLAYFDPRQNRVARATTKAVALTVTPGGNGLATAVTAGAPGGDARAPAFAGASGLALRNDLDPASAWLPHVGWKTLAALLLVTLIVHGTAWGSTRVHRPGRPRSSAGTGAGGARAALRDIKKAAQAGQSKEAAAGLLERALLHAFGPLDGDGAASGGAEDEGRRKAREVLDEVRFLRYAPQLGDYSERIRDVADRAREVVRRWA